MPEQTFPATWIQRGKRLFICSQECGRDPFVLGYATFVETLSPGEFVGAKCSICDKLLSAPPAPAPPPPATTARDRVLDRFREEMEVCIQAREVVANDGRPNDIDFIDRLISGYAIAIRAIKLSAPAENPGGQNADNR